MIFWKGQYYKNRNQKEIVMGQGRRKDLLQCTLKKFGGAIEQCLDCDDWYT